MQMPIVSVIQRFDPALDRAPADILRTTGRVSVELRDGHRVQLSSQAKNSVGILGVLSELKRLGRPVFLEADPDGNLTRLLIPQATYVTDIQPDADNTCVNVTLTELHSRNVVRRGAPDFDQLVASLNEAKNEQRRIIVTQDYDNNIIDVRAFDVSMALPASPPRRRPEPERIHFPHPELGIQYDILADDRFTLFELVGGNSCNPTVEPSSPCVPFLYPYNGCSPRAHKMCLKMQNEAGLAPQKIFITASNNKFLHAATENWWNCYVEWKWHVAPLVRVLFQKSGAHQFTMHYMVFDPSLFDVPVYVDKFKNFLGDADATFEIAASSRYNLAGSNAPSEDDVDAELGGYACALHNLCYTSVGAPPYSKCRIA
jgi:hypothetical protein